jgi:dihydroflavonol-4-reductase
VCVTGANGFIASWLVRDLLARGVRVRGTVRHRPRAAHLRALPNASESLEIFEADLLVPGAFDVAVAGCSHVFHTASPYVIDVKNPQRDLVDPAVLGSSNVLAACAKAPSVRRLVLTSSIGAVTDEPESDRVFTESDWNTTSRLDRNPYHLSKTLAERAAWDFVVRQRPHFDLVVINPFMVIGPSLGSGVNASNQLLVDLLGGRYPAIFDLSWAMVDVRDVAEAHIRAGEVPATRGRYLCGQATVTMRELVSWLAEASNGRGPSCRVSDSTRPWGAGSYGSWLAVCHPDGGVTFEPTSADTLTSTRRKSGRNWGWNFGL